MAGSPAPSPSGESPRAGAAERRVLVIDDEESVRYAVGKGLKRAGYVVETAATGREGVDRLRAGGFHAVVTDVRLPDLSGLAIVALLTETSPGTPVVVMTAYGSVETALEAMKRGARDFLTKPFETAALVGVLEREIARAAQKDASGPSSDDARLRVRVERKFAPEGYARVESEMRRQSSEASASGVADGAGAAAADEPSAAPPGERAAPE